MNARNWRRISAGLSEDAATPGPTAPLTREQLAVNGQVWDSYTLARDFEVEAFTAPFVIVIRRCDGKRGRLHYQHEPRFYWGFSPA